MGFEWQSFLAKGNQVACFFMDGYSSVMSCHLSGSLLFACEVVRWRNCFIGRLFDPDGSRHGLQTAKRH